MREATKKVAGVAGSALMLASMGMGAATAYAGEEATPAADEQAVAEAGRSSRVVEEAVVGKFDFTQAAITPTDNIAKMISAAAKYICGSTVAVSDGEASIEGWTITVNGAVDDGYIATVEEIIEEEEQQALILGCSCTGNPADGMASINVEVTGVSVASLIAKAHPDADANTVVFGSADGYEVALPLDYVFSRYAPIVFDVNGAPLAESMGGVNQLWLGSTSARYFARDIVSITLESRQTPPPKPGSAEAEDAYANLPNVGVFYGGTVE